MGRPEDIKAAAAAHYLKAKDPSMSNFEAGAKWADANSEQTLLAAIRDLEAQIAAKDQQIASLIAAQELGDGA